MKYFIVVFMLLSIGCAPENDPTKKYKVDGFVPLAEKDQLQQEFLPSDNLIWNVERVGSSVWSVGEVNKIKVSLTSEIRGLEGLNLDVQIGQNNTLPKWISVTKDITTQGTVKLLISGNPEDRSDLEKKVSDYEILIKLKYNESKSSKLSKDILQFYPSKLSKKIDLKVQGI